MTQLGCPIVTLPRALLATTLPRQVVEASSQESGDGTAIGARREIRRVLLARSLRGVVDGCVGVILASYLAHLGFSPAAIGFIVTGTLFGSGVLTLVAGFVAARFGERRLLRFSAAVMMATGLGFALSEDYAALLIIGVFGTLNPSGGDVSPFLPLEQALLAELKVTTVARTQLFARYNVVGSFAGALGALCAGIPELLSRLALLSLVTAERLVFWVYAATGACVSWMYSGLMRTATRPVASAGLGTSRAVVFRLATLFSLDSFGGGFVGQSLLALWLFQRFQLSVSAAGAFFFAASLLGTASQFVSPWLAGRIGLVRTMVYTHIPANLFLVSAAFMPSLPWTLACLLLRSSLSSMDVPARQAYVMAVVPKEKRAPAASVTNVPRSLAASASPVLAGLLLQHSSFGWPLVCAGGLKVVYDVLLLIQFQRVPHA